MRTTSMSIVFLKLLAMPGIVQTGRWMTAKWQRSRRILFGLSPFVAVGYLSATPVSRIAATASS